VDVDALIHRKGESLGRRGVGEQWRTVPVGQASGVSDVVDVVMGHEDGSDFPSLGAQLRQEIVQASALALVVACGLDHDQAIASNDQRVRRRRRRQGRTSQRETPNAIRQLFGSHHG
jgi:hypothetical protein